MPALGEEFRSAREARGLSLSEVSEQIHIRSVYLNAIENEDWPSIGAPVYVRGFLRTYARFLGLDAEDAVERFNRTVPLERHHAPAAATTAAAERESAGVSPWAMIAVAVALVLVAFVGYEWWAYAHGAPAPTVASGPQPAATPAGSETAAPDATAPASASPLPSASPTPSVRHEIAIRLTERSWLRVTVDGKTRMEAIYPAGTARTFHGTIADVRAGNAGGVVLEVDGQPTPPLGKAGDVVEHTYKL